MYKYSDLRDKVLEGDAQGDILSTLGCARSAIDVAGCVTMETLMNNKFLRSGDSWIMMAYVDRLVELGYLREVIQRDEPAGQHRIFMKGRQL